MVNQRPARTVEAHKDWHSAVVCATAALYVLENPHLYRSFEKKLREVLVNDLKESGTVARDKLPEVVYHFIEHVVQGKLHHGGAPGGPDA